MRKNIVSFSFFILIIVFLFFLTGCSDDITDNDVKSKATQELEYLDTQIVSIVNKLNNISLQNYTIASEEVSLSEESSGGSSSEGTGNSGGTTGGQQKESNSQSGTGQGSEKSNITATQMEPKAVLDSDENDIDWKSLKSEIEIINDTWGVAILDLSSLNVDSNDILGFSSTLDDCILSIKDENKVDSLTNIAKLYSYIPKFEAGISSANSTQNIKQVKSYIINAYSLVEQGDWTGIESNISECEKTFKNLSNDMEYIKDKEYKVNKTYVLLKELQNSLQYKDRKLFYVKYSNLLENVNTL